MAEVQTTPITESDADEVARFLHRELNSRVSVGGWKALLLPPWPHAGPHRGYQLHVDGELVGVYAAVFSQRPTADGAPVRVCNLAAFCVREEHRMHSVRLIRALLAQRDCQFTDLSPSGNVVAMNERLGFRRLDTGTRLIVNVPRRGRGIRISADPEVLAATLRGRDREIHRDHTSAAAARHLLVQHGDDYAYLVFRVVTRKRLRAFAAPLYAGGDRALLERAWPQVRSHLLTRHGLPFVLAERRILGFATGIGAELTQPRPKMVRGDLMPDDAVDYLYSELVLVDW
ncbi:hypothetical protein [Microbacterium sp.]|uniref:hypothetical protein n=1 Tax=Microbacterium sp. TaxID=51671 RepID=UPI0028A04E6F|nr:hypothetical protein [Microbacterium sp.]